MSMSRVSRPALSDPTSCSPRTLSKQITCGRFSCVAPIRRGFRTKNGKEDIANFLSLISCVRRRKIPGAGPFFRLVNTPSRLWKDTIDHGRCPFTRLHANLESHQSFERSSLSSVYRPRGLGCLACTGSDDRNGPCVRWPSWRRISDVAVLSFIRAGVPRQNLGAGRPFHGTVRRTYAPDKDYPSDHL